MSPDSPGERVLERAKRDNQGFLTLTQAQRVANDSNTRLQPLLVRFHQGRFIASAQDVIELVPTLEDAGWVLRDIRIRDDIPPGLQMREESFVQDILNVEGLEGLRERFGPFYEPGE